MDRPMRLLRCFLYLLPVVLMTFGVAIFRLSLSKEVRFLEAGSLVTGLFNATSGAARLTDTQMNRLGGTFKSYPDALANRASPKKDIILALMDKAALPMAVNFWETSLKPHNIENYLFISSNREACQKLTNKYALPCFLYMEDQASAQNSIYMSTDFKRKMNIRTFMILEALQLGYKVLHTDIDEVWFKNPLSDFECSGKCDIAALWDCGAMNAGFVYVKPTPMGIAVYTHMKHTAKRTSLDDQTAFNNALRALRNKGLKVARLPDNKYKCGSLYYEREHRTFAGDNPCTTCVVAHNNWIVSLEAKTYRFKELHQWMFDENGYYSSPDRKYIAYGNPYITDMEKTVRYDVQGFKYALALGSVLNRTVILPKFHCGSAKKPRKCSILDHLKVRDLDHVFAQKYRESTFLTHPKVPGDVKKSSSQIFIIESKLATDHPDIVKDCPNCVRHKPKDVNKGAVPDEILVWFKDNSKSVLNFHSLCGAISLTDFPEALQSQLKAAFQPGKYRQF